MKQIKYSFRLMLICMTVLAARGACAEQAASEDQTAAPAIAFDKTELDLGTQDEGTIVPFEFVIYNKGNADLQILRAKGSCGCTDVKVNDETIAPGESTVIEGKFNTTGRPGPQHKTISVQSNDPVKPNVQLQFTAKVITDLNITPRYVQFGKISPKDSQTRNILIEYRGTDALELKNVELVSVPVFEFKEVRRTVAPMHDYEKDEAQKLTTYEYEVIYKGGADLGPVAGYLSADTNIEKQPKIQVRVRADFTGDIEYKPVRLIFGTLKPGQSTSKVLDLKTRSGKPFEIKSVKVENNPIEWEILETKKPSEKQIQFTLNMPKDIKKHLRSKIVIETDVPDSPRIQLDVYANIRW